MSTHWKTVTTEPNLLGESPFWHPDELQLYWVDISARLICRCNVFMGSVQTWSVPSEPGCIAPMEGGGLVVALRDGIYLAPTWGGDLQLLTRLDYPTATTRANDGKCDALGRFWVGTYYEPRNQPLAALYCVDVRNRGLTQVRKMANESQVANGLAWSPDSKHLYWADTGSHKVWKWDWSLEDNVLVHPRCFAQFSPKSAQDPIAYRGRPDGAAVDSEGNYWVAMYEGARVLKFSPEGQELADIPTPAQCPTMVCFGGDDLQTLYLTTARQKRAQAELDVYPESGCVFSLRVDVAGLPVNFFQGGAA